MTWARGSTRQSRRQRELVLQMWPICHLQYPGCTTIATQDDHVIPLSQGGSDNLTNHRGACASCHRRKSQAESGNSRRQRRPLLCSPTESAPHPGLLGAPTPHPPPPGHRNV